MKKGFLKAICLVGVLAFTIPVVGYCYKASCKESVVLDDNTKIKRLFRAVEEDDIEVVKLLIETGVNVNVKNDNGDTPLHIVRNVEIAKLLVKNGADINARNNNGDTPLHKTYRLNLYEGFTQLPSVERNEVGSLLIENGADQDAKNNQGRKPGDFGEYKYYTFYLLLFQ